MSHNALQTRCTIIDDTITVTPACELIVQEASYVRKPDGYFDQGTRELGKLYILRPGDDIANFESARAAAIAKAIWTPDVVGVYPRELLAVVAAVEELGMARATFSHAVN